jgi:hypothetical protein
MRKLTLDLEMLNVQAFETMPRPETSAGTVHGHESYERPCSPMCPSMYNEATTCQVSDLGSCVATCASCINSCYGPATCVTCQGTACEETV